MTEPFPFIVARGRSGTTLLRAMLDSHPEMAIPPESHFVVPMIRHRRGLESRHRLSIDAFVNDLSRRYGFVRWGLDIRDVETRLRDAAPLDVADAIREVFASYAQARGKTRYAEKTPINVLHLDLLARTFPEARFIHLIRDGRDVALSYLDADFGVRTIEDAALQWRRFVRRGMRSGRRLGPDRYLEVRYEDLVTRPDDELRTVCDFVDIGFDPAMLRYHERAGDLLRDTSHPEHHGRIALPPTAGLRDWRREMDADSLASFEAIAGDLLGSLGYERGAPALSRSVRRAAGRARRELLIGRVKGRLDRSPVRRSVGRRTKEKNSSAARPGFPPSVDPERATGDVR